MDTRIITVAEVNIRNILTTLSLFDSVITLFNNSLHYLFLIISIVIDAPQDEINTLSGKIGKLKGITSKVAYSKTYKD